MKKSVAILLILFSCAKKEPEKKILTKGQFASYLIDVYTAEARLDGVNQVRDSTIKYYIPQEKKIFAKYHMTDSILKNTYIYYFNHPKEFDEIYESMIDTLMLREQRAQKAAIDEKKSPHAIPNPKPN